MLYIPYIQRRSTPPAGPCTHALAIAICVKLNALDGFDMLSISFASPGIAKEWAIDRAALDLVLSFELMGMLTVTYFMHILTFYFILKWVPKVVADVGYSPSLAGGVLVWVNVGGLLGGLVFAGLSLRLPLRVSMSLEYCPEVAL